MSTKTDSDLEGEVDFDFFESPRKSNEAKKKQTPSNFGDIASAIDSTSDSDKNDIDSSDDDTRRIQKTSKNGNKKWQISRSHTPQHTDQHHSSHFKNSNGPISEKMTKEERGISSESGEKNLKSKKDIVKPTAECGSDNDSDGYSDSFTGDSDTDSDAQSDSDDIYVSDSDTDADSDLSIDDLQIKNVEIAEKRKKCGNVSSSTQQAWADSVKYKSKDDRSQTKRCRNSSCSSYSSTGSVANHVSETHKWSENSGSEGEITDVSPLSSVQNSPKTSNEKRKHLHRNTTDTSISDFGISKEEKLDFNILVRALSELEGDKARQSENGLKSNSYNNRRVMFAPERCPPKKSNTSKCNYSFDRDKSHNIEKENCRLLQQIKNRQSSKLMNCKSQSTIDNATFLRRPATAAINRSKLQQKIDQENMGILKRLQEVKPTKGLVREEQIKDYQKVMLRGQSLKLPSRGVTKSPYHEDLCQISQRPGSVNSLKHFRTLRSGASSCNSSRPTSAKSQLSTVSVRSAQSVKSRPEWNDRW